MTASWESLDPLETMPVDRGRNYGQPSPETDGQDPATPGGPSPFNGVGPTSTPVATDPLWLDPQDNHHLRKTPMPNLGPGPDVDITTLKSSGVAAAEAMYAAFRSHGGFDPTSFDHRNHELPDLDTQRREDDLNSLHHRYGDGGGEFKQDPSGEHYFSVSHPSGWEARHYPHDTTVSFHHPGQQEGPLSQVSIDDGTDRPHKNFGSSQIHHVLQSIVKQHAPDYEALPHLNEWMAMNARYSSAQYQEGPR